MYRRCLVPSLNALTRIAKPQFSVNNTTNPKCASRDIKLFRSFATTTAPEYSTDKLEKVTYEEVKSLTNNKKVVIIDVREPNELVEHGILPGSINIPCEVEETLKSMSDDQFLKKYGRNKPDDRTPVVFSCMKGARSEKAQITALKLGYQNVKNYLGGWMDWAEKNKK